MKKILLIGDSIRAGYDKYVKMALDGIAEVEYSQDCNRFASFVLRMIPEFCKTYGKDLDLVHWNAGLWDCLRLDDGVIFSDIEVYKSYIERTCASLKRHFKNASFIFATSTSVIEEGYNKNVMHRLNSDIEAYNAAALEIVTRHGMAVNDLYTLTTSIPKEYHSDATHYYTKDGTRVITDQVIAHIEASLGIKAKTLDYDALFRDKTDIVGI